MTALRLLLVAALFVAGCGLDGPPVPPPPKEEDTAATRGVTVSGSISAGISGSR